MKFSPIAIVGQSCVLPGAFSPEELWQGLVEGCRYFSKATSADWSFAPESLVESGAYKTDKVPHTQGAYVRGFEEIFDANGFAIDTDFIQRLDPLFQWVLHCGRELLRGFKWKEYSKRTAVVLGNLSYPTATFNALAKSIWTKSVESSPDPYNRFVAGYPAKLLSQALDLRGPAYCLDAGCASSLYAIKNACDLLHDGQVDLAITGGVNATDAAFLHLGFSALKALSIKGQCLPFSKHADGLVPARGAAFVALRRLEDAVRDQNPILGVIRGIGLSNDGRAGGLLSPSVVAQQEALHRAYAQCDLQPKDVSYLECHATGTLIGDRCELETLRAIFGERSTLALGSLKANMGHLLAASGAASLIKILKSFEHNAIAPLLDIRDPIAELEQSSFVRPLQIQEWLSPNPKRAAINSFGFGGNNAHLIVEEYREAAVARGDQHELVRVEIHKREIPVAIVGLGVRWGSLASKQDFLASLKTQESECFEDLQSDQNAIESFAIDIASLNFPPNELQGLLAQQTLLIPTIADALDDLSQVPSQNTGILVGVGTDAEACRFHLRQNFINSHVNFDDTSLPLLDATRVLGCMPNVPANRFNLMKNWKGPSYTVSGEEESGLVALQLAKRSLQNSEVDCMVVAAVDLSCEPVHQNSARACLSSKKHTPADGAVVIVLKRLADAKRDADPIYAILEEDTLKTVDAVFDGSITQRYGHAHAASGLLEVFAATLKLNFSKLKSAKVEIESFGSLSSLCLQAFSENILSFKESLMTQSVQQRIVSVHPPQPSFESPMRILPSAPLLAPIVGSYMPPVLFDRESLKIHACGSLSQIFGLEFSEIDSYQIRVRMPEPPLLLTDRVTGISAEKASMGCGSITTETDIEQNAWYVHHGRMQAGPAIEAGQSDLFLISYLGVDFENKGERTYRLLGCEATFHRDLPQVGETLCFEIFIDRHMKNGRARLFFFHYNCFIGDELFLSVREGQAGFFSEAELATSQGVIWDPNQIQAEKTYRPLRVSDTVRSFSLDDVRRFATGDALGCFGLGYENLSFHTRTPSIPSGDLFLLGAIPQLDPRGGPWGQGYVKVLRTISKDDWFFQGHFTNDPCMPGTLMTEMAFQALSFFMAAMGYTLGRDGYRFIPALGEACKLTCRGQVRPDSKQIVLEVFIKNIDDKKLSVTADVLLTVDSLKALRAENIAVQLVPDWPSQEFRRYSNNAEPVAMFESIACDERQVADVVAGRPSKAWGSRFQRFDDGTRVARLPGTPLTFISRILKLDAQYCGMQNNARILAEWDIPDDNPLFQKHSDLPFCVVLESLLQPCGWLASYIGCPLVSSKELFFRNLEGDLLLIEQVKFEKSIRTDVRVTSLVQVQDTIIVEFAIEASTGGKVFARVNTRFGYFTAEALAAQKGIPISSFEQNVLDQYDPNNAEPLPLDFGQGSVKVFSPSLKLLDTVQAWTMSDSSYALGCLLGERKVQASDWFFKSHFFQDPVMPGSLGIESILQLLRVFLLKNNDLDPQKHTSFALLEPGQSIQWKYRGQIVPHHKTMQVIAKVESHSSLVARGEAALIVDGVKIYELKNATVGIVSNPSP